MKKIPFIFTLRWLLLTLAVFSYTPSAFALSLDDDDELLDTAFESIYDPIEPVNRGIHAFNDVLLDYIARPISDGYVYITPRFARTGIKNVFHNALFPVRFVNNLLQGKGRAAGVEFSRFFLNTTAGLGGLINVAENHKTIVPMDDEDLGQTFGVWGIGSGPYLVLPFLGPSTVRDTVGMVGDYFLDPLTYVSPESVSWSLAGGRVLNSLDEVLDTYDAINDSAVEPYTAFRDAYVQHRKARIAQ